MTKKHGNEVVHKIYPNQPVYSELFKNNNEWLRDIIVGLCQQLDKIEGKVINNKIVMSNIVRIGEKKVSLVDWSASAIREKIVTLDQHKLVKCTDPTLK